jgi:hypothetical protein
MASPRQPTAAGSAAMFENVQPAVPLEDVVSVDSETEHPAHAEEFAAVAVLATLAYEADGTGSMLPPLWPRVLHACFTDNIFSTAVMPGVTSIPELIRALRSPIPRHQHNGALGIKRLLYPWDEGGLTDEIVAAGVMPLLARLLGNGAAPHATQFEAVWALASVAYLGISRHVQHVANTPGAVKGIVDFVGSTDRHDACEHAVRALGNIAGESNIFRDQLLESGVLAATLKVASQTNVPLSLRLNVALTISQLCRSKPPLGTIAVAIPFLIEASQSRDHAFACKGVRALLSIMSGGDCDGISAVIDHGALPVIVRRLSISALNLYLIGNIVEGNECHIAQAVAHGAIPALCAAWRKSWQGFDESNTIVLGILGKIATGNMDHIHALLQVGTFDLIAGDLSGDLSGDLDGVEMRQEYQRTVGITLRDASPADCAAIIQSTTFQWLISAAQQGYLIRAGAEALAVAFERAFDIVATVVSADALRQLVETLSSSADAKEECRGPIDRIRGIVGGGTERPASGRQFIQGPAASRHPPGGASEKRSGACTVA